jgi:hypothetical protein
MKNFWNDGRSFWLNCIAWIFAVALILGIAFGFMCLNSWFIMLVWNATIPAIFGISAITFWQAFGLNLLTWLFFGGVGKSIVKLFKREE